MARPPIPLNSHGAVLVLRLGPKKYAARCRYRDADGVARLVERHGVSKTAARLALQAAIKDRHTPTKVGLSGESRFREAAELWLAGVGRKSAPGTVYAYERRLDSKILPALGSLRLRECTTPRIEAFLTMLEDQGWKPNYRRGVRDVVRGVLNTAVKHGGLPANPCDSLDRIEGGRKQPRGLTPEERRRLLDFLDGDAAARRRDLPDLTRFMLGTGCRLGEALAVRWCDLDLDGVEVGEGDELRRVPIVKITHTVTRVMGEGVQRRPTKTMAGQRIIPLPQFVVQMLRERRTDIHLDETPVFPSAGRDGLNFRDPSHVSHWIRLARKEVGLDWMTSHTWRKTFLTILDDEMGLSDRAKADLAGHSRFLKDIYVSRGELHPQAAGYLDAALGD